MWLNMSSHIVKFASGETEPMLTVIPTYPGRYQINISQDKCSTLFPLEADAYTKVYPI